MANSVQIEVGATEDASPVLKKVADEADRQTQRINGAFKGQADASQRAAVKANDLEREWKKLTSGTEFLAEGVQGVRGALNSIVWGTLIGAATAATIQFVRFALASKEAAVNTENLNKGILDQAQKLGLLSKTNLEVTRSTVDLYNAELDLAQFRAVRDQASRAEKIRQLNEESEAARRKNREDGIALEMMELGHPLILTTSAAIANRAEKVLLNAIAIENLNKQDLDAIAILKLKKTTIDEVSLATGNLTAEQVKQEALGRMILREAQAQRAAQLGIEKQLTADSLANDIQAINEEIAAVEAQERLLDQIETRGIIGQAERDEADLERARKHQEALGRVIRDGAQMNWRIVQETERLKMQAQVDTFTATAALAEAAFIFAGQKSRALFNIVKAAAAAEAVVKTYQAANQVLADPMLPYFAKAPAVAATVAMGLANLARITSASFGGGGGGGGGGSIGSLGGGSQTTGNDLRGTGDTGRAVQISLQVNALDPASVDWDRLVQEQIAPAFGEHLQRGGATGNVQITFERN